MDIEMIHGHRVLFIPDREMFKIPGAEEVRRGRASVTSGQSWLSGVFLPPGLL